MIFKLNVIHLLLKIYWLHIRSKVAIISGGSSVGDNFLQDARQQLIKSLAAFITKNSEGNWHLGMLLSSNSCPGHTPQKC